LRGHRLARPPSCAARTSALSHASALELLGLFAGCLNEDLIDACAARIGPGEKTNYYLIDSFDSLDIAKIAGLGRAWLYQVINDMLRGVGRIDKPSLVQGLSDYHHMNGESFEGLNIVLKYADRFEAIKDWAAEFYAYGQIRRRRKAFA
jgi:hypothetical protein